MFQHFSFNSITIRFTMCNNNNKKLQIFIVFNNGQIFDLFFMEYFNEYCRIDTL